MILKAKIEGKVVIVGLGEASHGVAESSLIKFEIIQDLIERKGARHIGFERAYLLGLDVDRSLDAGAGSNRPTYPSTGIHATQEVFDCIDYLHSFNRHADGERIHFFGFDAKPHGPDGNWDLLDDLYKRIPSPSGEHEASYNFLLKTPFASGPGPDDLVQDGLLPQRLEALASLKAAVDPADREAARRFTILEGYLKFIHRGDESANTGRDRAMAELTRDYAAGLPAGSVVVLWAHDGHIGRLHDFPEGQHWNDPVLSDQLGYFLSLREDVVYRAVGFETPRLQSPSRRMAEEAAVQCSANLERAAQEREAVRASGDERAIREAEGVFVKAQTALEQQIRLGESIREPALSRLIGETLRFSEETGRLSGEPVGCILDLTRLENGEAGIRDGVGDVTLVLTSTSKTLEPWWCPNLSAHQPYRIPGHLSNVYDFIIYTKESRRRMVDEMGNRS